MTRILCFKANFADIATISSACSNSILLFSLIFIPFVMKLQSNTTRMYRVPGIDVENKCTKSNMILSDYTSKKVYFSIQKIKK